MAIHWKDIVAEKRARQAAAIPKAWLITPPPADVLDVTTFPDTCGLLTPKEVEITNTIDVAVLLAKMASSEWSAVEVTTAFYKRAIVAQQVINCLTEIYVERALARAAELDAHLKATGKVVGPLHGLPISLKDQIPQKGLECTMGYVSWIGKYYEKDAVLVQILLEAGAVPFVQTNVPQTLMWPESYNKVFGRTSNPNNRSLSCGGSSGGEGALVGIKGSPLGVGSDIGGSVRLPAAYNGVFGLRGSYGRVPYGGSVNSLEGQDSILSVLGPLSHSMNGIKLFIKAVADSKPWLKDPMARYAPWNEELYKLAEHGGGKKLTFGFMYDNGIVVPHPPIARALEITKAALLAAGHEIIEWKPYKHAELEDVAFKIWTSGQKEDYAAVTAPTGEPIITSMYPADEDLDPQPDRGFIPSTGDISAYDLWQLHLKKRTLRQEHLEIWNDTVKVTSTGRPVDALITPAAPHTAMPHGHNRSASYTVVWNTLDYAACVFPVTKVDQKVDVKKPRSEFLSDLDKEYYEFYDPAKFVNAPVGLQLVGRCQEEEAVIGMTEIVAEALKKYGSA